MKERKKIILISVYGSKAIIGMYKIEKNGRLTEILQTRGFIGVNGIGKTKEGDGKTPRGTFKIGKIFGLNKNPRNKRKIHIDK